jgi:hypothetical protein
MATVFMRATLALFALAIVLCGVTVARARQSPPAELRYESGSRLRLPENYREWAWVSSGLGMVYEGEAQRPGRPPVFTNVFVNPSSYRAFLDTGRWPDRTVFILEFRASQTAGSINTAGHYQGALLSVEAEVKDARFPDGWAFYNFGGGASFQTTTAPIEDPARCVECHTKHTAVERTFVQFYPTLLDAARKHGTLKPGF